MIRFAERWRRRREPAQPRIGAGVRLYCVGDIHGRLDLLEQVQDLIRLDAAEHAGDSKIVYLGDYIDRGPHSRQVIERLLEDPLEGFEAIHLRGNHEQAMMDFLAHPEATAAWLMFGGREALASYGIDCSRSPGAEELRALATALDEALPEAHRSFMASTPLQWREGDYYFVHAGIRPGVPLHAQHPDDQLWIRDEFTDSSLDHGAVIVHGHTITPEPEFRPNRIGLDTGAFHTGVLTCLVLEGPDRRLIQTAGSPR